MGIPNRTAKKHIGKLVKLGCSEKGQAPRPFMMWCACHEESGRESGRHDPMSIQGACFAVYRAMDRAAMAR